VPVGVGLPLAADVPGGAVGEWLLKISNHHERTFTAPPEQIAGLIADFGRVWPTQLAAAPRVRGHRLYDAELMLWKEFDRPGATRAFRVVKPDELKAEHWFELEPAAGATVLRHTVDRCVSGKYEVIWRERIEPLCTLAALGRVRRWSARRSQGCRVTKPGGETALSPAGDIPW
jgi:hypothetical protein